MQHITILSPAWGHLTTGEKNAIKAILEAGQTSARVGRTDYYLKPDGAGEYRVSIAKKGRGIGIGGDLRVEQRKLIIRVT